jgi:hypothetical protein
MAVGFSNTNKPLNPRGQDASPKGYNRASLFSGKALDFDGVNDYVDCGSIEVQSFSLITNVYLDLLSNTDTLAGNWDSSNGFMLYKNASNNMFVYINSAKVQTDISQYVGNWTQFVATYDGTTAKLYANGVLINSEAYAATITYSSGSTFKVGAYGNTPGGLLNGDVAGTKLFNTALTAAQVADLYNNPEKVVPTGLESNLKLWLPMMEGAGTTAYDGSGNGNHGTISGATYVNGIGAPSPQSAVMDWNKGVNYVKQSEDFDNSDWSKLLNLGGTLDRTPNYAEAPDGTQTATRIEASHDGGAGDSYAILSTTASTSTSGSYTSAVWIKSNTGSAQTISFYTRGSATNTLDITTEWVRYDIEGSGTSNYFNFGARSSTGTTQDCDFLVWGASINYGTEVDSYVPTYGSGQENEVLLPQGLTTGRDITGVNLFENVRKQGALNLDGNSWAEVHDNASLDITSAISVEAWVYADEFADMNGAGIIAKWDEFSEQSYLFYTLDYNTYYFFISSTGSNNDNVTFSLDSADENKYNHLVCVYDGSNITMYKNGNVAVTKATALSSLYVSDKVLEIGRYDLSTTRTIETKIAQPRIYNRALTAAEVLQNYNSGKNTYK